MLYVEVTEILEWARDFRNLTGVQRVTYNALINLVAVLGPERVRLLAFSTKHNAYRSAPVSHPRKIWGESSGAHPFFSSGMSWLWGSSRAIDQQSRQWHPVRFNQSDTVLLMEGWWWDEQVVPAHLSLKQSYGPKIYRFIHDIIPLFAGQFFNESFNIQFETGLRAELSLCDAVIVNSNATAQDVRTFMSGGDISAEIKLKPIHIVPLAHEFQPQPTRILSLPQRFKRAFADRAAHRQLADAIRTATQKPYALYVGTLENRKNILRLLEVWESLYNSHGTGLPNLVLAGRWGSPHSHFQDFLNDSNYVGGRVKLLCGVTDKDLAHLYTHCRFSIYLSLYEGWGLPVGESLWFNKPVLASNLSSIPEVGLDMAEYVDPHDHEQIKSKIESLCFDDAWLARSAGRIDRQRLRTWCDVAHDLSRAMALEHPGQH